MMTKFDVIPKAGPMRSVLAADCKVEDESIVFLDGHGHVVETVPKSDVSSVYGFNQVHPVILA